MNSLYILPDYFTWLTIPVTLLSILFSVYIYRKTVPLIPSPQKYILISLRSAGLILIILLICHPQIVTEKNISKFPSVTIWFDKSGSMDKNLTTGKENELKAQLTTLFSDSIQFDFRYFSQTAEDVALQSKSWRSKTDFSDVIKKTNSSYNLVITDGIFNDFEWMLSGSSKSWDALILGDTSKTRGFQLLPLIQPTLTAYEGDDLKLYASVAYQGMKNDSVSIQFDLQKESKSVSVTANSDAGSKTASATFTVPESGEYSYSVTMKGKSKPEIKKGKLIVKQRVQMVVLVASKPDPLLGYFSRQVSKIGKTEIRIIIDSEKEDIRKITELPSQNAVYILINYPIRKSEFLEKLKVKLKTNPALFISNETVISSEINFLPKKWEIIPTQLSFQTWLPDLKNSGAVPNFWSGWNQSMIEEFPPFSSPLISIPMEKEYLSSVKIERQKTELTSHLLLRENPKSLWLLYGNYDQWERWDAINNIVPPRISQTTINFLTWMMTPADISPVKLNIQTNFTKANLNLLISLNDKMSRDSDSLQIKLKWGNTDLTSFSKEESGMLSSEVPFPAEDKTPYQLTVMKNGAINYTLNGTYSKPEETEEKEVIKSSAEPLSDWIISKNGNLFIQNLNTTVIAERLNSLSKTEIEKTVYDAWKNIYLFILIISLFTAEWFIRKRLGAL